MFVVHTNIVITKQSVVEIRVTCHESFGRCHFHVPNKHLVTALIKVSCARFMYAGVKSYKVLKLTAQNVFP